MNANDLYKSFEAIDDDTLIKSEKRSRSRLVTWIAAAAAALLVAGGVFTTVRAAGRHNGLEGPSVYVPTENPTEYATENPRSELPSDTPVVTPEASAQPSEQASETPEVIPTEAVSQQPTELPTQGPTENPTPEPTEAPSAKPTETPTQKPTPELTPGPTATPTQRPTEKPTQAPTPTPTQAPTPTPTAIPTQQPTPTPTVAVPTDAPFLYEFSSEKELVTAIEAGGGVFDSIRYYYAPKHAPSGASLTSVSVGNAGIGFDYSGSKGIYGFMWLWNTDPEEYIAQLLPIVNEEQHGRYYAYHSNGKLFVVWGQDNAAFIASVPEETTWDEIDYFCDARLVTVR